MNKIKRIRALPSQILIGLIRVYQLLISPALAARCRFEPSCSAYAIEALHQWGLVKGLYFMVRRLVRCHPWCAPGYDPVPERRSCCFIQRSSSHE